MLGTTIKWSFLGCLVLLPVSCWQADTLPDAIDAVAELTEDPEQVTARLAPFHVEQGGGRTDTGNGACETVYVTDFALLRASPSPWPVLQSFAGYGLLGSLLAWVVTALKDWL